ncbi:hypothetical protein Tsubulata_032051 [Turnera subulata]|uniref:GATA-type domain-containing protein n=1 Tax=Turnera subulata TaxID=218843 RepID=A0A9Q0JFG5_9ROSI|nr:hypothetical protein Tsubulata_032051 [Turnera subulata]
MDLITKGSGSDDNSSSSSGSSVSSPSKCEEVKRKCINCQTTKTPCWRSGPAGPRTLCNACGIRNRKRMRAVLAADKGGAEKRKKKIVKSSSGTKLGMQFKMGLMGIGGDILLQGGGWKRKLGEEEQAAMLLMALSCGSVYA